MIAIPSKSEKECSLLVDGLRILAWQDYKAKYKPAEGEEPLKGLKLYEVFSAEWDSYEVHQMDLLKVQKLVKSLGYSEAEIKEIRQDYYSRKSNYRNGNGNGNNQYQESNDSDDNPVF